MFLRFFQLLAEARQEDDGKENNDGIAGSLPLVQIVKTGGIVFSEEIRTKEEHRSKDSASQVESGNNSKKRDKHDCVTGYRICRNFQFSRLV